MTEKTYGFCESKCKHEVYTKDDFTILRGAIDVKAESGAIASGVVEIEYPEGFTVDNTVVLSIGARSGDNPNFIYQPACGTHALAKVHGYFDGFVTLTSDSINVTVFNPSSTINLELQFKLVIMKVE